jgi:hypothetical protein
MEKTYKMCQSCGMPLNKDPKGGGTNADGSRSAMYCSNCFENGKFTQPDLTVKEMQQLVKTQMRKMGFIFSLMSGMFVKGIPKLERWNSNLKEKAPAK